MIVERAGQHFLRFVVAGEGGGIRALARITAIQIVAETDCVGDEVLVTVANRTYRVGATLDELEAAITQPWRGGKASSYSDKATTAPEEPTRVERATEVGEA